MQPHQNITLIDDLLCFFNVVGVKWRPTIGSVLELKTLLNGQPKTVEQEKAKAFWFFSYACNGMNVKDIANIKYKDFIDEDTFYYYRNKIKDTDVEHKPIIIYLNPFTKEVIKKYGNKKLTTKHTYIQYYLKALVKRKRTERLIISTVLLVCI